MSYQIQEFKVNENSAYLTGVDITLDENKNTNQPASCKSVNEIISELRNVLIIKGAYTSATQAIEVGGLEVGDHFILLSGGGTIADNVVTLGDGNTQIDKISIDEKTILRFNDKYLYLNETKTSLLLLNEYTPITLTTITNKPFVSDTYGYYNEKVYWKISEPFSNGSFTHAEIPINIGSLFLYNGEFYHYTENGLEKMEDDEGSPVSAVVNDSSIFSLVGHPHASTGAIIANTAFVHTPYIRIPENKTFTMSAYDGGTAVSSHAFITFYDANFKFVSSASYNTGTSAAFIEKTITADDIPENAVYFIGISTPKAVTENRVYIKGIMGIHTENIAMINEKVAKLGGTDIEGDISTIAGSKTEQIYFESIQYIINVSTGKPNSVAGTGYSGLIPVEQGEKYQYSGKATAYNIGVAGYDSNKNLVSKIIYNATDAVIKQEICEKVEFEIPDGVSYIACSTRDNEANPLSVYKVLSGDYKENANVPAAYNIFDGYSVNSTTGVNYSANNVQVTDFIKVEEGEYLRITAQYSDSAGIAGYDKDKVYNIRLADNNSNSFYFAKIMKYTLIRIPAGVNFIKVPTVDRENYPVKVLRVKEMNKVIQDISRYQNELVYAWFGDSISQLGSLPHIVGNKLGSKVIDCSFAGAPLTYSSAMYQGTGFMEIANCIAIGEFTLVEEALQQQEDSGINVTKKRINLENLKTVNWNEVDNIVILAGTNDMSYASATLDNIKSGLSTAFQTLITAYPHLNVYFISPPYRGTVTNDVNGLSLLQINEAIKEVCESFNFPFFDFFHNCGVNQYNKGYYLDSQEVHPTQNGEALWSTKLANWLKSL